MMRCRWAGVTCPSSRLAGMPSIAACSSGIGPTTSRRRLWSKAYLHMACVAEACDALRGVGAYCGEEAAAVFWTPKLARLRVAMQKALDALPS